MKRKIYIYISRSVHYKQNKARNFRKILDRTTHHRHRNHVRNMIAQNKLNGVEDIPPPSSSKLRKESIYSGRDSSISNR